MATIQVICADQIYRTRANCAFCQRHSIRLSGPRLGRPKTAPQLLAEEKKQFLMISDNGMLLRARLAKGSGAMDWI
jgi:hypothetical protein